MFREEKIAGIGMLSWKLLLVWKRKNNAICTNFKLFRRKDIHVTKLGEEDVLPNLISPGNS